jgi:hypothetical protein
MTAVESELSVGAKVKAAVAEHFDMIANFRTSKSSICPGDVRNDNCAEALTALSAYCLSLGDEDPIWTRLSKLDLFGPLGDYDFFVEPSTDLLDVSDSGMMSRRYGFDGPPETPAEFFQKWVVQVEQDCVYEKEFA